MLRRSAMRCLQFSCSQTLGLLALAHGFPGSFSGFARVRIARLACFRASRTCALLPSAYFWALRVCALFPRHVFGLCACAHGFPGVFSGFSRLRICRPARFRASRVRALLPQRVFGFLACAHCFPGAFPAFSRLRTASPACLSQGKALLTSFPTENSRASRACARLSVARRSCASSQRDALLTVFLLANSRALRGGGRGKILSIWFGQK